MIENGDADAVKASVGDVTSYPLRGTLICPMCDLNVGTTFALQTDLHKALLAVSPAYNRPISTMLISAYSELLESRDRLNDQSLKVRVIGDWREEDVGNLIGEYAEANPKLDHIGLERFETECTKLVHDFVIQVSTKGFKNVTCERGILFEQTAYSLLLVAAVPMAVDNDEEPGSEFCPTSP